jgi:Holliday junction resolvasome RuvABC DNA-binding subunit
LPSAASEELIAALTALGYNTAQIQTALRAVPIDPALNLEEKIILALRTLSPQ